jgi:hypothetical protein
VVRPFSICVRTDNLYRFPGQASPPSLDLWKATKLKDVAFQRGERSIEWVTTALQSITPEHQDLRQVLIQLPRYLTFHGLFVNLREFVGEASYEKWLGLDRLLVQLWESHSIRPKVVSATAHKKESIGVLFPEITERGIIDLVERPLA